MQQLRKRIEAAEKELKRLSVAEKRSAGGGLCSTIRQAMIRRKEAELAPMYNQLMKEAND